VCEPLVESLDLREGDRVLVGQHGERPEGRQRNAALAAVDQAAAGIKSDVMVRAFKWAIDAFVFGNA